MITRFSEGMTLPLTLAATALIALLAVTGFEVLPTWDKNTEARIRLELDTPSVRIGETFTTRVVVDAATPVNVFAGELSYDEQIVHIDSIDYNTSIADLWAEKPWYENGEGTMNFGGGTTKEGGFTGTGTLISISLRAVGTGSTALALTNARVLKYDGLGTDALLAPPIDSVLTVIDPGHTKESLAAVTITPPGTPSPDLNNDGVISFKDASILMLNLLSDDLRYDLNGDGEVSSRDLELLSF